MSFEKPVIHKSAIARPVDYIKRTDRRYLFFFLILRTVVRQNVVRNAKCHSDGFNGGEVFSTGGRELKEAQVP